MKHARPDYDRIQDPSGKIPEDEPVFLLRGQDKTAANTVRYWANQQKDMELARLAMDQAAAMDLWPFKKDADR